MKALSEQLSELSLRAESVEDAFAAAETEAEGKGRCAQSAYRCENRG
jgi:hypothetical protein